MQHKLFPVAAVTTLTLDIGGIGCVASPTVAWVVGLALPIVILVAIAAVYLIALLVAKAEVSSVSSRLQPPLAAAKAHFAGYTRLHVRRWVLSVSTSKLALAFLSTVYVFAVRTSLDVFNCVDVLGSSVLASDTSVACSGQGYLVRQVIGAACAAVYGIGIPAVFAVLLSASR